MAFHPFHSTLLSASGSRHFHPENNGIGDSETSSDSDESREDADGEEMAKKTGITTTKRRSRPHPVTLDSSMKLWDFTTA